MTKDPGDGGPRQGVLSETLVAELEALGLGAYEARVLLTLLHVESATSAELARHSGVPRTSIYQVVDALTDRGLALRVPSEGPARWCSPGHDEVLDRIYRLEEDRLRLQRDRLERIRSIMRDAFPEATSAMLAYAHVIHGTAQLGGMRDHLVETVKAELLVMHQPPYPNEEQADPLVLAALGRGVDHRILYQRDGWDSPALAGHRRPVDTYLTAGARARLVRSVPMTMAVADRQVVLISITDSGDAEIGYPTTLLVEHPGFAAVQATGFERMWEQSHSLPGRP